MLSSIEEPGRIPKHPRQAVVSDAARNPGALTAEFPNYAIKLGSHRLPLGTVSAVAPKVVLTNLNELRATGEDPTARYECADGEGICYRVGPLAPTNEGGNR
jgi:hypothetical protein